MVKGKGHGNRSPRQAGPGHGHGERPDLRVRIAGLELENPVMSASGTPCAR